MRCDCRVRVSVGIRADGGLGTFNNRVYSILSTSTLGDEPGSRSS